MNDFYVNVDVTRKHIDNGNAARPYSCPVALAIRDAIRQEFPNEAVDERTAGVSARKVYLRLNEEVYRARMPIVATHIVNRVDSSEPREYISPASFPLHFVPADD